MTFFPKTMFLLSICMVCLAVPTNAKDRRAIEELRTMVKADQVGRSSPGEIEPKVDEARQQRVLALLANGQITEPEAKECAALILQHSSLRFCDGSLQAISLDNYLLAHLLAKSAADHGKKSARPLAAACLDRFLVYSGKPQKYGTQYVLDPKTEKMVTAPVDPATSDEERAKWGVQPLSEYLKGSQ